MSESQGATAPGRRSRLAVFTRPVSLIACLWLTLVLVVVVIGPWVFDIGPLDQDLRSVRFGPSSAHWLGTDSLGRDILSRLATGGRPTLSGAILAVAVFLAVGVPLGVLAGYFGSWIDRVVSLFAELVFAIPGIIILLVVLAVFGNSMSISMITLGILGSAGLIRVLRGSTMAVKNELYVRAARTSGLTEMQILRRHVVPRLIGSILVQTFLFAGAAIMVETAVGFLGFGKAPPAPSWGNLVADASQAINNHPWLLVPTGGTIMLTVLSLGLLGDAVRDLAVDRQAPSTRTAPSRTSLVAVVDPPGTDAVDTTSDPESDALLRVSGLTVSIAGSGGNIVEQVAFDVRRGEIVGLVGESGCGKSVTSMAILGLLKGQLVVSSGSIAFDGADLEALSPAERRRTRGTGIAFVAQEPVASLDPAFTVGQQLREVVRRHHRVNRSEADRRVVDLLRLVQLDDPERVATRYPHQLSGGMAQRVGIAAAIAGEPKLLIADEPTTALDVTVQAEILALLRHLRDATGMAVILVTHDFGVLAETCDRAIVMYAGEIVEVAPVAELLTTPRMPYTAALIRSNPALVETGETLPSIPGSVPPPLAWPDGCRFRERCELADDGCAHGRVALIRLTRDRLSRCRRIDELTRRAGDDVSSVSHRSDAVHTEPTSGSLLEVEHLTVRYRSRSETFTALRDVSVSLATGRTLGLVGGSGAGKSTLGAAVLGLTPVTEGRIAFDGRDITRVDAATRRALTRDIQVIFQDPYSSLNPSRTVRQTLGEPLRLTLGLSASETRHRIDELLTQVGLPLDAADRYPSHFSGGQRQRIAIARALAMKPRLVVCDEAVSALDLSVQAQVLNLLKSLQRELGLSYLFISHDLDVVRHMADDIAVLYRGELVEYGDAAQVYRQPQHVYTRQLLDAIPSGRLAAIGGGNMSTGGGSDRG